MISLITLLLVVSTTSSVLSFSDYTLDRYRERDQTIRHGKSKFNKQSAAALLLWMFPSFCRMFQLLVKEKKGPRLRGRGISRIKKFKSRGNFRAVEKKYPLQFENYKSVTGKCRDCFLQKYIWCKNACKNINSDINWGITGTVGDKNDRGGGKMLKLSPWQPLWLEEFKLNWYPAYSSPSQQCWADYNENLSPPLGVIKV